MNLKKVLALGTALTIAAAAGADFAADTKPAKEAPPAAAATPADKAAAATPADKAAPAKATKKVHKKDKEKEREHKS
ncbi:MAG: hypothetical protein IT532_17680 [Burkholderiales bacterium]|nr:hypothetical protein [Burkholderiales bacterium]